MSYKNKYKPIVGENWRYDPNSSSPFKLSRGKIESFCNCERCFYFEVRLGFREPSGPGWAINSAVDTLLKKKLNIAEKKIDRMGFLKNII